MYHSNPDMKLSITKVRSIDPDQTGPLVIHYHTTVGQCAPLTTFWSPWPGLFLDMKKPHSLSVPESLYIAEAQRKPPPSSQDPQKSLIYHFQKINLVIQWPERWTKPNKTSQLLSWVREIQSVTLIVRFNTPRRTHIITLTFQSHLVNVLQCQT